MEKERENKIVAVAAGQNLHSSARASNLEDVTLRRHV